MAKDRFRDERRTRPVEPEYTPSVPDEPVVDEPREWVQPAPTKALQLMYGHEIASIPGGVATAAYSENPANIELINRIKGRHARDVQTEIEELAVVSPELACLVPWARQHPHAHVVVL